MTHLKNRPGLVFGTGLGGMSQQPARYTKAPTFVRPDEYDPMWRDGAACVSEDPELFFPVGETGPALLQIEDAKSVCYGCPVIDSCFTWAMQAGVEGIWGGTTATERGQAKRRQLRQASKRRAAS